ncbi:MAG: transglycosylase SLT domain-containing protein, partial [Thermoanaerobaculia bacterium]
MTRRKRILIAAAAASLVVIAVAAILLTRERVRRQRVFHPSAGETKAEPPAEIPPVEQWTPTFATLSGDDLDDLLDAIEKRQPDLYKKYSLAYLHARALADENDNAEAIRKLEPYLRKGHPFRDRALYHRASLATGAEASRFRNALIFEHKDSAYRDEAVDDEIEYLVSLDDPRPLIAFAEKIAPSAPTERRREMSARIVEALVGQKQFDDAFNRGLALLRGGITDDAADRVTRALDRPELIARLNAEQLEVFGQTFQQHRHYDRAIALLQAALKAKPSDDLEFALGRCYFGAERYAEAQSVYLRNAKTTKKPEQKCMSLWHAARSAQLRGDDKTAEQLMTASIAVPGKFPSTLAALTQRLRTRLKQKRIREAAADLVLLRKLAGKERAILEGSLAYAVGMLAAGNSAAALSALNSIPRNLQNDYDRAEIAYWRARAFEQRDRAAAIRTYAEVLDANVPSHFDVFARQRLAKLRPENPNQLQALRERYRQTPRYREVLELTPQPLPRFPNVDPNDPDALLMAMGLHDEAVPAIEKRYPLRPARSALTRSYALNLAGASRASIYAIEVMMKSVPKDFHPELLPEVVQQLLYPRYFYGAIVQDADRYDADPTLVLSIMREESRFNPRAKSQAAARGLLQVIITTARDIGR